MFQVLNFLFTNFHYFLQELINTKIQDLCHPTDLNKLNAHLKDVLLVGESVSPMYRMHIATDKFLNVQTKSKFFKAGSGTNGV